MSSPVPWSDARSRILAANLGVPIAWENETLVQPEDSLWLIVEMTSNVLQPIEMGADAWQEDGTLWVHVMVPTGSGTDAARALGKQIVTLFRNLAPNPVVYMSASIGAGAVSDEAGNWWRLTCTVAYQYQDVNTQ